ncbi:glycosyltransferase family 2 protein [Brevundimonas diminuta]|uniref:glycosyltransferase family 2 protein n=1 Tax=Brevundimonas diminuta TaxID=293 RepID=UPI0032097998
MSARITLTRVQMLFLFVTAAITLTLTVFFPPPFTALTFCLQGGFLCLAVWRGVLLWKSRRWRQRQPPPAYPSQKDEWPRYTVVAALYHETAVLPHLIERLAEIDYPADRLEGFLVLEADDEATISLAVALPKPDWLHVLVAPAGAPKTKPRALNYALSRASGDLITIYDAEDDPDPLQLREAAERFSADDGTLACVQAPLRIRSRGKSLSPFLDRQFAAEYAALFEITLPAMTRLGMPFPLGGTSNHFRVPVLRALGGWDAWNVTEDADLGFRIWRAGYRLGVIQRPTYEPPPGSLNLWLPQRTRWLKGYLQTLAVHTRSSHGMGWRGWTALSVTIMAGLASAALHALCTAWVLSLALASLVAGRLPHFSIAGSAVLVSGIIAAWLIKKRGARLAGVPYKLKDMVLSLGYWCLLSMAFCHAAVRLLLEPHHWDKTPHQAIDDPDIVTTDVADAGRAAA